MCSTKQWKRLGRNDKTIATTMDDLSELSVLNNNKQEPVFWCIIKKGAVQEPFANHRVGVSVRKLMKSDLVSPSAV